MFGRLKFRTRLDPKCSVGAETWKWFCLFWRQWRETLKAAGEETGVANQTTIEDCEEKKKRFTVRCTGAASLCDLVGKDSMKIVWECVQAGSSAYYLA